MSIASPFNLPDLEAARRLPFNMAGGFAASLVLHGIVGTMIVLTVWQLGPPPATAPNVMDVEIFTWTPRPATTAEPVLELATEAPIEPAAEPLRKTPTPSPSEHGTWQPLDLSAVQAARRARDLKALMEASRCPDFTAPHVNSAAPSPCPLPGPAFTGERGPHHTVIAAKQEDIALQQGWALVLQPPPLAQIEAAAQSKPAAAGDEAYGPWPWE